MNVKFSIITPTLLRESLLRTCKSVDDQSYQSEAAPTAIRVAALFFERGGGDSFEVAIEPGTTGFNAGWNLLKSILW